MATKTIKTTDADKLVERVTATLGLPRFTHRPSGEVIAWSSTGKAYGHGGGTTTEFARLNVVDLPPNTSDCVLRGAAHRLYLWRPDMSECWVFDRNSGWHERPKLSLDMDKADQARLNRDMEALEAERLELEQAQVARVAKAKQYKLQAKAMEKAAKEDKAREEDLKAQVERMSAAGYATREKP